MKKYLKMLPLILLPYLIFVLAPVLDGLSTLFTGTDNSEFFSFYILPILLLIFAIYIFVLPIQNTIVTIMGKYSAREAGKVNFVLKLSHIPMYILNFILGALSFLASIWGIGILAFVIIADVILISLTGLNSIGCIVRMRREKVITTPVTVLFIIGSFIFCADIVIAIICFVLVLKRTEKPNPKAINESISEPTIAS